MRDLDNDPTIKVSVKGGRVHYAIWSDGELRVSWDLPPESAVELGHYSLQGAKVALGE